MIRSGVVIPGTDKEMLSEILFKYRIKPCILSRELGITRRVLDRILNGDSISYKFHKRLLGSYLRLILDESEKEDSDD